MGKMLLFFMGCLFAPSAALYGQSTAYQPIFTPQTQWNLFVLQYATGAMLPTVQRTLKDTTMAGAEHQVFSEDALGAKSRNVYLREDITTRKVYVIDGDETRVLYDFNLKKGDFFQFKDLKFEVYSEEDISLSDGIHKQIKLKCLTKAADLLVWIEGVGATISPLYYKHYASTEVDVKVTCFFRKEKFVYGLTDYDCVLPVATNDFADSKLSLETTPNPFSNDLKINIKNTENEDLKLNLSSIAGVSLYQESFSFPSQEMDFYLDLAHIPNGIYLLTIASAKKVITRKIIKT
jgi:hypothetical protein